MAKAAWSVSQACWRQTLTARKSPICLIGVSTPYSLVSKLKSLRLRSATSGCRICGNWKNLLVTRPVLCVGYLPAQLRKLPKPPCALVVTPLKQKRRSKSAIRFLRFIKSIPSNTNLSLQTFETFRDSFGTLLADAVNHLKAAARDEFFEIVERGNLEFLVKRSGGLQPYAADAQEIERGFRRLKDDLLPCLECASFK